MIPRQWKVIQHVREKMTCRDCEKISEPPAPFHVTPRGWAGPQPPGHAAVREVRAAPAAEPSGRALCAGRRAARACRRSPIRSAPAAPCWSRFSGASRRTSSPPSVCTATTPPCPCSPRARPSPDAAGSTCATIARLAGARRRRRCSTTRAIAAASILEAHLADWSGLLQADAYGGYNQLYAAERTARADPGGGLLGACAPAVLRARRYRGQCPSQGRRQDAGTDLAAGAGGGPAHRCPVRDRARRSMAGAPRSAARFARS